MAKPCKNCKDSIISRTPSIIGEAICNPDCPQEFTCEDILPVGCFFYSGANLSCSGINFGDRVDTAFAKVDAQLCSNQANNCLFKISSDDTCCGYFQTKVLAGNGLTFTVGGAGTCETITLSTQCATWNTILASSASGTGRFRNKWQSIDATGSTFQPAQWSTAKECTVRLRGTVTITQFDVTKEVIAVLPVAPVSVRRYSVNVLKNSNSFPIAALIDVYPDGSVKLFSNIALSETLVLSLDGIIFDTN